MKSRIPFTAFGLAAVGMAIGVAFSPYAACQQRSVSHENALTVPMKPIHTAATHPSGNHIQRDFTEERIPVSQFARQGQVVVAGKTYHLYLTPETTYTTKNTGKEDMENTSSVLFVDENGDGWISTDERRHADMPLRIGDQMFLVARIAADGSEIKLKPAEMPLESLLVGHRCPPFAYKTLSGASISDQSLKGKAYLIDVWSFT
jgi:hypothetical protein